MKISTVAHIVLITTAGILLSGCIHRNRKAWSDQRESGNAPPSQPSVTPEPTATPTPTLQEFIEQKMKELDAIDEELSEIDQILRSPSDLDKPD